jgi:hypothetical protein
MPADLTNTQRKYVHELAKKLGLKSKSYGKGEDRKVVVSKIDEGKSGSEGQHMPINVGKGGEEALRRHLQRFPPTEIERMESLETGSSLLVKQQEDGVDLMQRAIMNASPPKVEPKQQINDGTSKQQQAVVKRRIQNHVRAQKAMKSHPQYKKMMVQRKNLPAFEYAEDVCRVLRDARNRVVILTGDTGCGCVFQDAQ